MDAQPRAKAYSYLRFSTPEQARGDSFRRQTERAADYAATHRLELDETLTLEDKGVSGFRGRNARKGALRLFLDSIEDGKVPEGSYLLVENLDRMSRQDPWDALPTFQQIINAGVTIVTLQDGRVWSREELRAQPFRIMESLIVMIRANEESATKARRLREVWGNKRSNAASKPLTSVGPGWLRMNSDGRFEVIEERADVVRRVYALTAQGWGQHRIAEALNREGVPTFAGAAMWHRSYISKMLESPAVVGTYVPHEISYDAADRRKRRPLDPVPGYYPAIVAPEAYEAVQAQRLSGRVPAVKGSRELSNMLAQLARCPVCAGTMTRVNKGNGPKGGKPYLVCVKAKQGAGCNYRTVRLDQVEDAIRANASAIVAFAPSGNEGLDDEWESLETQLEGLSDAVDHVVDAIAAGGLSPALNAKLREYETERERLQSGQRELGRKIAAASGPLLAKRLGELEVVLGVDPLNRAAANAVLRQLFTGVVVDYRRGQLRFNWTHGGETEVVFGWPEDDQPLRP
jgi:DNA invertase Pin-like site-specific DNA recombinase